LDSLLLDKLSRLVVDSDEFTLIDARTHQFCPFEAIGMVRQEIRHSNFLAYLLDPARPHGIGDVALRALLITLAEGNSAQRLDFHFRDLSSLRLRSKSMHQSGTPSYPIMQTASQRDTLGGNGTLSFAF
jgi:hypothetical protein